MDRCHKHLARAFLDKRFYGGNNRASGINHVINNKNVLSRYIACHITHSRFPGFRPVLIDNRHIGLWPGDCLAKLLRCLPPANVRRSGYKKFSRNTPVVRRRRIKQSPNKINNQVQSGNMLHGPVKKALGSRRMKIKTDHLGNTGRAHQRVSH